MEVLTDQQRSELNQQLSKLPSFRRGLTAALLEPDAKLYDAAKIETLKLLKDLTGKNADTLIPSYKEKLEAFYKNRLNDKMLGQPALALLTSVQDAASQFLDMENNAGAVHQTLINGGFPTTSVMRYFEVINVETIGLFQDIYHKRYGGSLKDDIKKYLPERDSGLLLAYISRTGDLSPEINGLKLYRAASTFGASNDDSVLNIMRSLSREDLTDALQYIKDHVTPKTGRSLDDWNNSLMARDRLLQTRALSVGEIYKDLAIEVSKFGKSLDDREHAFAFLRSRKVEDLAGIQAEFQKQFHEPIESFLRRQYGDFGVQRFERLKQGNVPEELAMGLKDLLDKRPPSIDTLEILLSTFNPQTRKETGNTYNNLYGERADVVAQQKFTSNADLLDFLSLANFGYRSSAAAFRRVLEKKDVTVADLLEVMSGITEAEFVSAALNYSVVFNSSLAEDIKSRSSHPEVLRRLERINPDEHTYEKDIKEVQQLSKEVRSGLMSSWSSRLKEEISVADAAQQAAQATVGATANTLLFPKISEELYGTLGRLALDEMSQANVIKVNQGKTIGTIVAAGVNIGLLVASEGSSVPSYARVAAIFGATLTAQTATKLALDGSSYRLSYLVGDALLEAIAAPASLAGSAVTERLLQGPIEKLVYRNLVDRIGERGLQRLNKQMLKEVFVDETERVLGSYGVHSHIISAGGAGFSSLAVSNADQGYAMWHGARYSGLQVIKDTSTGMVIGAILGTLPAVSELKNKIQRRLRPPAILPPVPESTHVEVRSEVSLPVEEGIRTVPSPEGRKLGSRDERMRDHVSEVEEPEHLVLNRLPITPSSNIPAANGNSGITRVQRGAPIPADELRGKVRTNDDTWSILSGDTKQRISLTPNDQAKARDYYRIVNESKTPAEILEKLPNAGFHRISSSHYRKATGREVDGDIYTLWLNRRDRLVFVMKPNGDWGDFWIGNYHNF